MFHANCGLKKEIFASSSEYNSKLGEFKGIFQSNKSVEESKTQTKVKLSPVFDQVSILKVFAKLHFGSPMKS